ncbi:hypothetical protein QUF64_14755 [Anaerolineales bacterium HSG6]|nr:hypothetical protein [Anaerolineales bacterium HSG6]MDM8530303.1 hypothetical protein [Anaerolineales bacterium HSG25]
MSSPILDPQVKAYIDSESEFKHVRLRGFLERVMGFITGHNMHLLSFDEVVDKLRLHESIFQGLHDIPVDSIVGSTGRYEEFTRHFFPMTGDQRNKERWRSIYTLAVTGKGFPPIDVYKIDQVYFVKDGNHRVSVARDLGWKTIQANVTELPSPITLTPDIEPDELLIKEGFAFFLEQTRLDRIRPDSKAHIDLTIPGGYQQLLWHIKLHRYLMRQHEDDPCSDVLPEESFVCVAQHWYDNVYLPTIQKFKKSNMMQHFPNRSEGDLYLWLIQNQAQLRQKYEFDDVHFPDIVEEFFHIFEEVEV